MKPSPPKPPTILVVDDSQDVCELICMVLGTEFTIVTGSNGLEAIDLYQKENPDLILMDVDMPEMDGYSACRRIKEMDRNHFIPIIFITSKGDLQSIKTGLQSGAEDYLKKPFEPEELIARVQAALRTKKLYNQLKNAYAIIDQERDIIAQIQQELLCDHPPQIPGFRFFSDYQPSSKAGGDYYDFIRIDEDHLGILVSDVSGHGSPATVIMAMMRVLLRSFLSKVRSPAETLDQINRILCENLVESGHFITAFYAVIHLPTRRMRYASAGHNPPILIEYDTGKVTTLTTNKGFPLIISPQNQMEEREQQLVPNSKLILYTDGLTEARNSEGEMFGTQRLEEDLLNLGRNLDPTALGNKIREAAFDFLQGTPFSDDYTLVILEVVGEPS